jgi:hypothetical protein
MSKFPGFGSEQPSVDTDARGLQSPNGVSPDDTTGIAGGSVVEPATSAASTGGDNGKSASDAWAEAEVGAAAEAGDDGSVFLAELVRTLQSTAGLERVRIAEETEQRRQAHIDQIRARQKAEADRMRELAGDDTKAIDEWAAGETKRIELERERRATRRNADLEFSLAEHTSKIDEEIDRVETAIAGYRADVDAFFDGLDRQTNLVLMAKQATHRPVFPALDALSKEDAAPPVDADDEAVGAGPEPGVVGVMDPDAAASPAESWLVPPETSDEHAVAAAFAEADQGGEPRRSRSVFSSLPVQRPMKDSSDRDD